jgi:DUF4097 and DUF4098 domain-containing protein YvlB
MKRIAIVLALAAPGLVWAQSKVEERRPAAPDGIVLIENADGSVRVIGWDKAEVLVTGTLGRRAEGLEIKGDGRRTRIEVVVDGPPHGVKNDLEIRVPAASRLHIESFGADITTADVKGPVRAESVNGSIAVAGGSREVDVQSVNGSVEVKSPATRVNAESVNGSVTIHDASGELAASTVNGRLLVVGGAFDRAHLETVSGSISFEGGLGARATLEVETVSGEAELVLPADVSADFSVSTFSGDIENELGPPARKGSRYTPEKELSFSTGSGGASVSVQTLSGNVALRKK